MRQARAMLASLTVCGRDDSDSLTSWPRIIAFRWFSDAGCPLLKYFAVQQSQHTEMNPRYLTKAGVPMAKLASVHPLDLNALPYYEGVLATLGFESRAISAA